MRSRSRSVLALALLFLFNSCALMPGVFSGAQREFERGLAHFNRGQYAQAIPYFQKAVELDAEFGRAHLYLGRSYISLQRWRLALPPLRAAYRLSPQETKREVFDLLMDALFAVGAEAFRAGDFPSAMEHFREILDLQPASPRARDELVRSLTSHGADLLTQGKISEAISSYSEAVKLSPSNFEALLGLARAYLRNGDFSRAFQSAQQALKIDPGNRDLQTLLQQLKK